jgi:hypothetical protein
MKEKFNWEFFNKPEKLKFTKEGIPLVLNKEKKLVESVQFKKILEMTNNYEKALEIYKAIKKLEKGEFKNSKLRDENGELMIVWHGSPRKFEKFDPKAKGQWRWRNEGIHFQSSKELVEQYAKKAHFAWETAVYSIGEELFNLKSGDVLAGEQLEKAREVFNEIIEDLIRNGEESKFYEKGYTPYYDKENKTVKMQRDPSFDVIVYGKQRFSIEWFLEIFGGEMPTKENCVFNEKYGTYFGKDIGEYYYAVILNIENPFYLECLNVDYGFELGEKSHREQGTDGTILFHPKNIIGEGGLEIPNTKNTYSIAIFDPDKIKIIGIETEKGFEISKEFLQESKSSKQE